MSRSRKKLRAAASIVEKVHFTQFEMRDLNYCILGHCRKEPGFEELDRNLDIGCFIPVAAKFFGIGRKESVALFGGEQDFTPITAAQALREAAAKGEKPGTAGVRVIKKAMARAVKAAAKVPEPV